MASPLHQTVRDSLPIRLGDRKYNIDVQRLERATVDPIRQGFDTQGTPGEQSLNQAAVWKRTRTDWSLGAGQLLGDGSESSTRRFNTSQGVNVWTEGEVTLLPKVSKVSSTDITSVNQYMVTAYSDSKTYIYVADGDDLEFSDDIAASWETPLADPCGSGLTIQGLASDGKNVYVAGDNSSGSGVVQSVTSGAKTGTTQNTHWWDLDGVDGVWVANGYLLASVGSRLTELNSGSAPAATADISIRTNQVSVWNSVVGTPVGIFAAGTQGDKSRIYYIGINDSGSETGGLSPAVIAAELPDGETVNVISYYGSLVCIGTTRGIRLATINGQGYLSYGPVIEISGGVSYLEAQGEFIWFNWDNYVSPFDEGSTINRSGLGRLNLKEFTSTIVPAYATDIMVTGTTAAVQGIITTSDNRRMFSISGVGVHLENASNGAKETTGWIDEGKFDWGVTELKTLVSGDIRHSKLQTGEALTMSITNDEYVFGSTATSVTIATSSTVDSSTSGLSNVTGTTGEWFIPTIKIEQTATNGTTPVLHRWTLRAIPMPFISEFISLPIILTTQTDYQKRHVWQDTWDDFNYLQTLLKAREMVSFEMGSESKTVYISGIAYQAGEILKWSDDDDWFEGILTVQIVSVQGQ